MASTETFTGRSLRDDPRLAPAARSDQRTPSRIWFVLVPLFLALAGCTSPAATLSDVDRSLGSAVSIPEPQLLSIKRAGKNLRRLEGLDDEGRARPGAGVTVDVPERKALAVIQRLRSDLDVGYLVYLSERNYGISGQHDHVSVLRGNDPFDMMRTMGTNAWNYGVGPDGVVAKLTEWNDRFDLDFHGVGFDWVEATFRREPSDMLAFAREVYAFCPDVVDQGTGSVEALAEEMARSNTLYLWWD